MYIYILYACIYYINVYKQPQWFLYLRSIYKYIHIHTHTHARTHTHIHTTTISLAKFTYMRVRTVHIYIRIINTFWDFPIYTFIHTPTHLQIFSLSLSLSLSTSISTSLLLYFYIFSLWWKKGIYRLAGFFFCRRTYIYIYINCAQKREREREREIERGFENFILKGGVNTHIILCMYILRIE